jgi:hypothetical protein
MREAASPGLVPARALLRAFSLRRRRAAGDVKEEEEGKENCVVLLLDVVKVYIC